MSKRNVPCSACSDTLRPDKHGVFGHAVTGRPGRYCQDCFDELENGKIRNQNITFHGGSGGPLDEDIGSYRTNAVRELEDGGA